MSITHEKRNTRFHLFSFSALRNLLTQTGLHFRMTGQLFFWTGKMYSNYLLLHLFLSLCHILYFDAAKFSIKPFSLIYFSVSIVRQRNEYEIVTETRPIKTTLPALSSKTLTCAQILIIVSLSDKIKKATHEIKTIAVLRFRLYLHVKLEKHIAFNWKRKAQLLSAARGNRKDAEWERERGVRALGKRDLALSR